MGQRDSLVKTLTNAINAHWTVMLTFEQVENWVGCDASNEQISEYIADFSSNPEAAVTPSDVLWLWDGEYHQNTNH